MAELDRLNEGRELKSASGRQLAFDEISDHSLGRLGQFEGQEYSLIVLPGENAVEFGLKSLEYQADGGADVEVNPQIADFRAAFGNVVDDDPVRYSLRFERSRPVDLPSFE